MSTRGVLRTWGSAAVLLAVGSGCGERTQKVIPADPVVVATGIAGPSQGVHSPNDAFVDPRGHTYVLATSIEEPGQRISVADFLAQIAHSGVIERGGFTFGNAVQGVSGQDAADRSPDFIATLDPNGSDTVIGFQRQADVFDPDWDRSEITILGSDGTTVVGAITLTRQVSEDDGIQHVVIVEEFIESEGGQR